MKYKPVKDTKVANKGSFLILWKTQNWALTGIHHPPSFHCWLLALLIGHDTSPKAKCPCSCTSCIDKGNNLHRKGNLKLKNSLKKAIMSSFQFEETLLMPIWVRLNVKISCSFTHAFFLSIVNMTSWWRKPFFDTACYQPATLITKLESVAGMWAWNS